MGQFRVSESEATSGSPSAFRGRKGIAAPVVALLSLLAFAVTMPHRAVAAPPGPWVSPAAELGPPAGPTNSPEVATGPEGTTVAYWRSKPGTNRILQARVRPPAGEFGPIENFSPASQDASQFVMAVGPDSTVRAIWSSYDGADTSLKTRVRSPGGALGPIEDLKPPGSGIGDPALSIGSEGTTAVTWNATNGTHSVVRTRIRPPDGDFAPEVLLSAPGEHSGSTQVVTAADGTITAAWTRGSGSDRMIQVRTRPPGGSFGPVQDLTTIAAPSSDPTMALGPDGTVAVGWYRTLGLNQHMPQFRTRPSGGAFGQTKTLDVPGEPAIDPLLAVGPDGAVTAIWTRMDGLWEILRSRSQPAGGQLGATNSLSLPGGSAQYPGLVAGPDGSEVVIWERDGAVDRVESRTRLPGGAFGPTQDLSEPGQGSNFPEIAIGPDSRATAVWGGPTPSSVYSISTLAPEFTLAAFNPEQARGTVTSVPAGIDCGADCLADYPSFTKVTLTATPTTGNTFAGWTGACDGTEPACELTMDEAMSVAADFQPVAAVCPPKKLKTGKLKKNRKKGIGKLKVTAGGKGKVILKGSKKVKKSAKKVGSNGRGKVRIKARGKAARALKRKGRFKLRVKLVYRPGGGCPNKAISRKVKLIRK